MKRKILRKGFLIIEMILYVVFIAMDLFHMDSSVVKYTGVVLCFLYSLAIGNTEGLLAFLFTLLADYFLLIRNDTYLFGILSFVVVQSVYAHILFCRGCRFLVPVRAFLLIISFSVLFLMGRFDLLNAVALFYFSLLSGNFLSSLTGKENRTLSTALFLFLCCDICVGLFNLIQGGPIYRFASMMMWVFYLPSQVLLAIGQEVDLLSFLFRKKQD